MSSMARNSANSAAKRSAIASCCSFRFWRFHSLCVNDGLMKAMLTDTTADIEADTKATSRALSISMKCYY